jgi:low molecular weight phosphotyrosine protein phosphatase
MAEAIMNHVIRKFSGKPFSKVDWMVTSAGLENEDNVGQLPEQRCLQVLHENKLNNVHCGRHIRTYDFRYFEYILCMDDEQLQKLVQLAPENKKARIYMVGDFIKGREKIIRDPTDVRLN